MDFLTQGDETIPRPPEDDKDVERYRDETMSKMEELYKNVRADLDSLIVFGKKSYVNLKIKCNAGNPTYQVDIAFDKLLIESVYRDTSFSKTIDITISGDGGLDTGAEANSTWYYIWAIAKADETVSCMFSVSSSTPTLPTDYIYKRLIGMVRNNAGGDFVTFQQEDKTYCYDTDLGITVLTGGTSGVYAEVNCAVAVPELVCKIILMMRIDFTPTASTTWDYFMDILGYINGSYSDSQQARIKGKRYAVTSVVNYHGHVAKIATFNRKLKYRVGADTATRDGNIMILGFEVEL